MMTNDTQTVPALTTRTVRKLTDAFPSYANSEEFLTGSRAIITGGGAASFTDGGPSIAEPISEIASRTRSAIAEGRSQNDVDAGIAIDLHRALTGLHRSAAADPRLWNRLGLLEFGEYMTSRWSWPKEGSKNGRERFLLPAEIGGARALTRHSISRLWWSAEIFHDPDLALPQSQRTGDPYAYVHLAFTGSNAERIRADIAERSTLSSVTGLAAHTLHRIQTSQLNSHEDDQEQLEGDWWREFLKRLVLVTGYIKFDKLDADERDRHFTRIEAECRDVERLSSPPASEGA